MLDRASVDDDGVAALTAALIRDADPDLEILRSGANRGRKEGRKS